MLSFNSIASANMHSHVFVLLCENLCFVVVHDRNATLVGLGVGVSTSISSHNGFRISRELVL
jgi:hypothetical protein